MQTQEPETASQQPSENTSNSKFPSLLPWRRATGVALIPFLLTRFVCFILWYFGGVLFTVPNYSPTPVPFHDLLYNLNQWNTTYFLGIATNGYTAPENTYFFPLYPTLIRLLSPLFRHDPLLAGLFLSNIAFLIAIIMVYRLVEMEFDGETARRAVWYTAIFPSAVFFFVAYSDALLFLFIVLTLYALRRRRWWLAGLFGALATLTDIRGALLFIVFLYEFARVGWPLLRGEKFSRNVLIKHVSVVASLFILLALAIYAYSLKKTFGDAFAFLHAQSYWGTGFAPPWTVIVLTLRDLVHLPRLLFVIPHDLIDLTALLLFLVLLALCFVGPERLRRDQWVFALSGALLLLYALLTPARAPSAGLPYDPLATMERSVLCIVVGFLMLARYGRRLWFHTTYLVVALPMFALLLLLFLTGRWVV
jgi:hypothetical protein